MHNQFLRALQGRAIYGAYVSIYLSNYYNIYVKLCSSLLFYMNIIEYRLNIMIDFLDCKYAGSLT